MRFYCLLFALLVNSHFLIAGEVVITGYAGGNISDKIHLYTYSDPLTGREKGVVNIYPSEDGRFSLVIDNEGVNEYIIRNGIHDNHFFIEDSTPIDLVLVPYRPLTDEQRQNPLFEYVNVQAASKGPGDLNNLILRFEELYYDASTEITSIIIKGGSSSDRGKVLENLRESSGTGNNHFLDAWILYRTAGLKLSGINDPGRRNSILKEVEGFFSPGNRSCTEFLADHYSHFLRELASGQEGAEVRGILRNHQSSSALVNIASSATGLKNEPLLEYIIIMNLYLEYYSRYFDNDDILALLKSMGINATSVENRALASLISEKIGRFAEGAPLPGFNLAAIDGKMYTPGSWEGKFILLSFGKSDSYTTLLEYNLLTRWLEQYGEYLEIVTILCDDDFPGGVRKMEESGYRWLMLDGSVNDELTSVYEVKFFPAFFLADQFGNIIKAPAPFPSENLMQVFQEKLQPYLMDDIRKR